MKDNALRIPKDQATRPKPSVAVILLIFRDSMSQATPGSINEIDELNAAMLNRIKNKVPKNQQSQKSKVPDPPKNKKNQS